MSLVGSNDHLPPDHQPPLPKSVFGAIAVILICFGFYGFYTWWQKTRNESSDVKIVTFSEPAEPSTPQAAKTPQAPRMANSAADSTVTDSTVTDNTVADSPASADGTAAPPASDVASVPRGAIPVQTIAITVAGRVSRPGRYRCPMGSRVQDAIGMAGGTLVDADLTKLDMSARLTDEMQIEVPPKVAAVNGSFREYEVSNRRESTAPTPQNTLQATVQHIDLNRATRQELESLPEVGPVLAQRIIEYRERNNGFKTVEELDAVKGIGTAKMETLRPLVTVQ